MAIFGGIDSGSSTTEFVIINEQNEVLAYHRTLTGGDILRSSREVLDHALKELGIEQQDISFIVATGYGRKSIGFAQRAVTEITCYGMGANFLSRDVRSIIDIGGQDSKVISVDGKGNVLNFAMNDKCAAGTGRFLEMLAGVFGISLDDLGELSAKSEKQLRVSSICAVFAESEMISLFSQGAAKEDIIRAAHLAVCERVANMLHRVGVEERVMFCGGVARNQGVMRAFEELLNLRLMIPDKVDHVGALGAALIAKKSAHPNP